MAIEANLTYDGDPPSVNKKGLDLLRFRHLHHPRKTRDTEGFIRGRRQGTLRLPNRRQWETGYVGANHRTALKGNHTPPRTGPVVLGGTAS